MPHFKRTGKIGVRLSLQYRMAGGRPFCIMWCIPSRAFVDGESEHIVCVCFFFASFLGSMAPVFVHRLFGFFFFFFYTIFSSCSFSPPCQKLGLCFRGFIFLSLNCEVIHQLRNKSMMNSPQKRAKKLQFLFFFNQIIRIKRVVLHLIFENSRQETNHFQLFFIKHTQM